MRWSGFFLTKILPMRRHISIHMMFQHGRRRDGGVRGSVRKTNAANNPPNRNPQPCQPSSTVDSAFTCKFGYIPDTKSPAPPISRAHIETCSSAHTEYASALDPHPKHDPHLSESVCRSWRFRRMPLHIGVQGRKRRGFRGRRRGRWRRRGRLGGSWFWGRGRRLRRGRRQRSWRQRRRRS